MFCSRPFCIFMHKGECREHLQVIVGSPCPSSKYCYLGLSIIICHHRHHWWWNVTSRSSNICIPEQLTYYLTAIQPHVSCSTVVQWLGLMILVAILSHAPTFKALVCGLFCVRTRYARPPVASDRCPYLWNALLRFLPFFGLPALTMMAEAAFRRQHSSASGKWGCFWMHRTLLHQIHEETLGQHIVLAVHETTSWIALTNIANCNAA